jgi:hypothetical protein
MKEPPQEVIAVTPTTSSDSDDDDWDNLKNMNPLYIGLGLTVVVCVILIASLAKDKKPIAIGDVSAMASYSDRHVTEGPVLTTKMNNEGEVSANTAWFEINTSMPAHKDAPIMAPKGMMVPVNEPSTSVLTQNDPQMSTRPDLPPREVPYVTKVSFLELMARNTMVGEIISVSKTGYTRFSRIIISFVIFEAIIALSGVFMEIGQSWTTAGFIAAACGLFIEPLLTVFLYSKSDTKINLPKAAIGFVLSGIISVVSLVATWYFTNEKGETFINDWMLALTAGFAAWFLVGQQICSLYKYALYRQSQANF